MTYLVNITGTPLAGIGYLLAILLVALSIAWYSIGMIGNSHGDGQPDYDACN